MKKTTVTIETKNVGKSFATVGVIRSARTGRVLAKTAEKPYGFDRAAIEAAESLASARGWTVEVAS